MRNWEEKYNQLKGNGVIDEKIVEQENLIRKYEEGRTSKNKKEYVEVYKKIEEAKKEKDRLEKIKPNLKKIENIIEFREAVIKKLEEYYIVKDLRNEMQKCNEEIEKATVQYDNLSDKITDLEANREKLEAKIENLEDEKDEEIRNILNELIELKRNELNELIGKITNNRNERQEIFNKRSTLILKNKENNDKLNNSKYKDIKPEKLEEKIRKFGSTIVKCNMACSNLMEGKELDDLNLDDSKEYKYRRPKVKKELVGVDKDKDKDADKDKDKDADKDVDKDVDKDKDKDSDLADMDRDDIAVRAEIGNKVKDIMESKGTKKDNIFKRFANKVKSLFSRNKKFEEATIFKTDERNTITENKEVELSEFKTDERNTITEKKEVEISDKDMDLMVDRILGDNKNIKTLSEVGESSFRNQMKVEIPAENKEKLAQWRKDNGYRTGDTGAEHGPKEEIRKIDKKVEEIIEAEKSER